MKANGFYTKKRERMEHSYNLAKFKVGYLLEKIDKLRKELKHAVKVEELAAEHLQRISRFARASEKNTARQHRSVYFNLDPSFLKSDELKTDDTIDLF